MSKLKENYKDSFSQKFSDFMTGDMEIPDEIHPRKKQAKADKVVHADEFFSEFTDADDIKRRELYQAFRSRKFMEWINRAYNIISVVVAIIIICVLLFTVSSLPTFGDKDNPVNNEVSQRYIEDGLDETGAIIIACCCVLILLRNDGDEPLADEDVVDFRRDIILEKAAKFLVPVILVFGIYVVLNGHLSPGGGFSGGAIMGAGLILFASAFGFEKMERLFSYKTFRRITFGALLFYGLAKSYSFFTGANHIESIIPLGTPGAILSSGLILYLNICVGLVVACTMYGFYTLFKRGRI